MPRRPAPVPAPPLEDRYFTPAELTERYGGLSELTLRNWRWRGEGPRFIKVGQATAISS